MRISDWSSYVCSSDLGFQHLLGIETQKFGILPQKTADIDRAGQVAEGAGFNGFEIGTANAETGGDIGQSEAAPLTDDFQAVADTLIGARIGSLRHGRLSAGDRKSTRLNSSH